MKPVFPNKVLAIFNEMVFCNWWSTVNLAGWLGESHIHKGHHMDQLDEQKEQSHVQFIGLGEFSIEYHIILINLQRLFFCLVSFMWKKVQVSQYDLFNSLCTAAVWMKCLESCLKEKKKERRKSWSYSCLNSVLLAVLNIYLKVAIANTFHCATGSCHGCSLLAALFRTPWIIISGIPFFLAFFFSFYFLICKSGILVH